MLVQLANLTMQLHEYLTCFNSRLATSQIADHADRHVHQRNNKSWPLLLYLLTRSLHYSL